VSGTKFVAGNENFVAGFVMWRRAFDDGARAVDARHVGKLLHDAGMALAGEGVFVVERRIGHVDQHVAGRQLVARD
jgi:hypothetical protein